VGARRSEFGAEPEPDGVVGAAARRSAAVAARRHQVAPRQCVATVSRIRSVSQKKSDSCIRISVADLFDLFFHFVFDELFRRTSDYAVKRVLGKVNHPPQQQTEQNIDFFDFFFRFSSLFRQRARTPRRCWWRIERQATCSRANS
jgi:hypothetical protein